MTESEIFSGLASHMVKGMMFHAQMADYYDFLQLRGYKRCHEYHFKAESCNYRKLNRYYINHYNKLIEEERVDDPNVIPESWYNYTRMDVDMQTKRTAVKTAITKWVKWERETKQKFEEAYSELCAQDHVASALFIKEFIKDVDCELKYAERKHIDLMSVDYDMPYILGEQKALHDKYKKML